MLRSQMWPVAVVTGALAMSLSFAGCSSKDDGNERNNLEFSFCGPVSTCPPNVDAVDFTTPVSFRNDIYAPYLVDSCNGSGCHSDRDSFSWRLSDDGAALSDDEITSTIAQWKATNSPVSGIKAVVEGDWQNSYLMMKLDGCQNESGLTCDPDADELILSQCDMACGDGMPASEGNTESPVPYPLDPTAVDLIRAWIAQGAPDN